MAILKIGRGQYLDALGSPDVRDRPPILGSRSLPDIVGRDASR